MSLLRKNKRLSLALLGFLSLVFALLVTAEIFNPALFTPGGGSNTTGGVSAVSTSTGQEATVGNDEGRSLAEVYEPRRTNGTAEAPWYGLCAKNSINSVEDFRRTVEADPILAQHYADFDFANARVEYLDKPMMAQVAFRKGDVIGYTKHKINLPKGDRYITDGVRKVRTFCCNDILDGAPVSPKTPMIVELNELPSGLSLGPDLSNELPGDQLFGGSVAGDDFAGGGDGGGVGGSGDPLPDGDPPLPPLPPLTETFTPGGGGGGGSPGGGGGGGSPGGGGGGGSSGGGGGEPPAPVPEPSTMALLGIGLAGMAFFERKRRK